MALKLRQIHDALQREVMQKTNRLVDMRRNVEERNSQVYVPLCMRIWFLGLARP